MPHASPLSCERRGGGSSVGRAPGCGPGGRGFESRSPPLCRLPAMGVRRARNTPLRDEITVDTPSASRAWWRSPALPGYLWRGALEEPERADRRAPPQALDAVGAAAGDLPARREDAAPGGETVDGRQAARAGVRGRRFARSGPARGTGPSRRPRRRLAPRRRRSPRRRRLRRRRRPGRRRLHADSRAEADAQAGADPDPDTDSDPDSCPKPTPTPTAAAGHRRPPRAERRRLHHSRCPSPAPTPTTPPPQTQTHQPKPPRGPPAVRRPPRRRRGRRARPPRRQ